MLLILPESIDFFIYILKNYPQGSFAPYKGRIITLPLVLIIFVVLFIISLKKYTAGAASDGRKGSAAS